MKVNRAIFAYCRAVTNVMAKKTRLNDDQGMKITSLREAE